jgi:hypothetical protein
MGEKGGENLIAKLRDYEITRLQDYKITRFSIPQYF